MKKNLNYTILAAIAAMLSFTACTNNEEAAVEQAPEAYVPEAISLNIGLDRLNVTRAQSIASATGATTIEGSWFEHCAIGVSTIDADNVYKIKDYYVSTDAGGYTATQAIEPVPTVTPSSVFYWHSKSDAGKVIKLFSDGTTTAMAPTVNTTTGALSFPKFEVAQDQTANPNKEFLYGVATIAYNASPGVGEQPGGDKTIALQHQLAKINVIVKANKNAADLALTIGNSTNKIITGGTFVEPSAPSGNEVLNQTTCGTWTITGEGKFSEGYVIPRCSVVPTAGTGANDGYYFTTFSAVVIPQDFEGTDMFCITYDGAQYKYIGAGDDDDLTEPGKEYTYTITIKNEAISVTQASITAWTSTDGRGRDGDLQ